MAGLKDQEIGNMFDISSEDDHLSAGIFDDTEKVENPLAETQIENLDKDTEELDVPDFVDNLRPLMVEDSDDEIVVDSDDEFISYQQDGRIRGHLLRRASTVAAQTLEVRSSTGSNLDQYNRQCNQDKTESGDMKMRKAHFSKLENANGGTNASVTVHDHKHSLGPRDESQELESLSQANALAFVDRYLSLTDLSPEVRIPKFDGLKSPLSSCSKGSQNLALKASLLTKVGTSIFDWDEGQPDHGGFHVKKKNELCIGTEKHLGRRYSKEVQGSVTIGSNKTFSKLVVQNSNPMSKVIQTDETERDACRVNHFGEGFEEETSRQLLVNLSTERDAPDILYVGLDTQMAAEAMEALLHAPPPGFDANECEGPKNTHSGTLEGATKKQISNQYSCTERADNGSQRYGRNLKGKRDISRRHNMSTSFDRHCKNQRELYPELLETGKVAKKKSLTEHCMDGVNLAESKKRARKKSSKVINQKKNEEDPEKENIQNGKIDLSRPGKLISFGQMQQKVKTYSPIACRTRRGLSIKHSDKTKDACNSRDIKHDKQSVVLDKRKRSDLDTNSMSGKSIRFPNLVSPEIKGQNHLNPATASNHLKFDTWKWPKQKRTRLNTRQNAKLESNLSAQSSVIKAGSGTGNPVVGRGESEENFRDAFWSLSVKRKARSSSKYPLASGKKHTKELSVPKFGEPGLADVTNSESVLKGTRMIPEISAGDKISSHCNKLADVKLKDASRNDKSGENIRQPHKRNSARFSLGKELTRLGFAESLLEFASKDFRRRKNNVEIRVLFSQSLNNHVIRQQKKIMERFGISVASGCSDATHFVTDRFARTKKMLEAMAFGKPVVTPSWLETCGEAKCFIDEKSYILRDAKKEKEFGFSMPASLSRARAHPLLKDRRVFVTPNVEPDKEMVASLVKAVQGQVVEGIHRVSMERKNLSDDVLILSCEQDYEICVPLLDQSAAVYSSELLLNGIVIQKLEYERHQLFNDHVKMKRYTRRRMEVGRNI